VASNTIKGLTVEIGGDTTKLGKAIKDVEAKSRSLSKELGDINKLLKMDPGNMDLLAQKQEVLAQAAEAAAKKLDTLKEAERQVQQQFERGEVSEEQLRALQREIVATENKMKGYQKAAQQTAQEIEQLGDGADQAGKDLGETGDEAKKAGKDVDDFGDAAEKAEKSSDGLGTTLANVAKTGFAAVAAACAAAIAGLVAAAESTREYRTEMGKLDTAFTQNGHTSEAALGAYRELQGILGETDQAVEAANHLAKLTDNEKELASWTGDILPGVFATFGASLPLEGLAEAA
jgi:phage-related minor tail protein